MSMRTVHTRPGAVIGHRRDGRPIRLQAGGSTPAPAGGPGPAGDGDGDGGKQPAPVDFAKYGLNVPPPDSTDPLPPTRQDPAIIAALAMADTYPKMLDAVRDNLDLSELEQAEQLNKIFEEQQTVIPALRDNLYARRQARLAHLDAQVPRGPGIDPFTTPADAAVMQTAFRTALKEARGATVDQRKAMLADALKFGDQTTIRALLTAAHENADEQLVDAWAAATRNQDLVAEIRGLHHQMNGGGEGVMWEVKAFQQPRRPPEVTALHGLRQQAAAEQERREQEREQRLAARLGVSVSQLRIGRERERAERQRAQNAQQ